MLGSQARATVNGKSCYIWLAPGTGEMAQQVRYLLPNLMTWAQSPDPMWWKEGKTLQVVLWTLCLSWHINLLCTPHHPIHTHSKNNGLPAGSNDDNHLYARSKIFLKHVLGYQCKTEQVYQPLGILNVPASNLVKSPPYMTHSPEAVHSTVYSAVAFCKRYDSQNLHYGKRLLTFLKALSGLQAPSYH